MQIINNIKNLEPELIEVITDMKIKVKLGKLLRICPPLRKISGDTWAKIKEGGIADACKVITTLVMTFFILHIKIL
jgi:tRNA splicing ligase